MEPMEMELKEIIINRYGSLKKFCEIIDMPWTTLDSILKRGVANSNITNVMKITKELKIDTESLASGIIVDSFQKTNEPQTIAAHSSINTSDLTEEEATDVANYIEFIKSKRTK